MVVENLKLQQMSCALFALLVFGHSLEIAAFGPVLESSVCGNDRIAFSFSHKDAFYYLNGNVIDQVQFCKAVQFYEANGCNFEDSFRYNVCELQTLLGRKVLQKKDSDGIRKEHKIHPNERNSDSKFLSIPQKISIAASGFFVLCCAFLCPCLQKERKATSHEVLSKYPSSEASSFEIRVAAEKAPASPLRAPPSPARFTNSPRCNRGRPVHLTLSQVTKATHNFSESLQIGEGGFGTVYKACLEDGQVVAIKRAKKEHFENLRKEFKSEVELLSKIDHRNLVKLLGYIDNGNERLIITEFVANGTLREHLDGLRGKILDFNQRLEIAIDICHGLTYLHLYAEKKIIHRDVKSSNILLTESMRAKVADFGFAKGGPVESNKTHISTQVKGTVGYLDPEYMRTYQLTPKSDVYSFGILLIEILTGRRPVESKRPFDERVTIRWAFSNYNEGNILGMVDPLMEEALDVRILKKMFHLAIRCAAPIRNDRPDMKAVGERLWAIRADYLKISRNV